MKAAILIEPHKPVLVEEVDLQDPKDGEVLVDLVGAGICHSDYHYVDGHIKPRKLPLVMGHEGSGIVEKIGPGVKSIKPGDKIIFSMDAMCGFCRNCTNGIPTLCETYGRTVTMPDGTNRFSKNGDPIYQSNGVGTYTEKTVVPADTVVKVSDDTPLEKACLIGCAVITGVGSVVNRAKVEKGSSVAVFGCGGVGLNVIQGSVFSSSSTIVAIDNNEFKLKKAKEMGATHTVNSAKEDPVQAITEITKGGVDYAFEVVGFPDILSQAFKSTRPGGTAVMVGVQPPDAKVSIDCTDLLMDRGLIGAYHGTARPRVDFQWLLDLYKTGRLNLDGLITKYRPLKEVNEAFEDMNKGLVARSILTFK